MAASTDIAKIPIALYVGSFNPFGLHHLATVRALSASFSKIVVIPKGWSGQGKKLESVEHRIEICRLTLAALTEELKESTEIVVEALGGTSKRSSSAATGFVSICYAAYGKHAYHAQGADIVCTGTWAKKTKNELNFVVVPREGFSLDSITWVREAPHFVLDILPISGSSTQWRKSRDPTLLHADATKYIEQNDLYTS